MTTPIYWKICNGGMCIGTTAYVHYMIPTQEEINMINDIVLKYCPQNTDVNTISLEDTFSSYTLAFSNRDAKFFHLINDIAHANLNSFFYHKLFCAKNRALPDGNYPYLMTLCAGTGF